MYNFPRLTCWGVGIAFDHDLIIQIHFDLPVLIQLDGNYMITTHIDMRTNSTED